ncbi:cytochrome c oxidase subunit 6A2, mitochondrial-like [Leptopilina boulardi]|uniref:cytochrome c oxidase subunit 6A2, mitochondrial-like n=1 Tax=Leptopilina boulardi TaxID=63433 RepID=UPI0021F62C3E|nr:cytochrome c oxidase subunit 6A2, mitochondrial-like [Leptopilina boulardi]
MASNLGRVVARRFSALPAGAKPGDYGESAAKGEKLWKMISLFVAVPAVIVTGAINYYEHVNHEHHRPEFIPYEHLRIRNKPFPWGDGNHSLFHNKHRNPLPTGYED